MPARGTFHFVYHLLNGILFLLFLALLSHPCSAFADGVGKYEDLKLYFPMNMGSVWIYDFLGESSGLITSVTNCMKDQDGIEICTFSNSTSYGRSNAGYSYLGDVVMERTRQPLGGEWTLSSQVELRSPLKVSGPIWEKSCSSENEKSKYRVVKILPTMAVKAGKFNNVIVVEHKNFIKDKKNKWKEYMVDGKKLIDYSYYAPNVGLIGVGYKGKLMKELIEYRPGEQR